MLSVRLCGSCTRLHAYSPMALLHCYIWVSLISYFCFAKCIIKRSSCSKLVSSLVMAYIRDLLTVTESCRCANAMSNGIASLTLVRDLICKYLFCMLLSSLTMHRSLGILIAMMCYQTVHPVNIILLGLWTFAEAIVVGVVVASYASLGAGAAVVQAAFLVSAHPVYHYNPLSLSKLALISTQPSAQPKCCSRCFM